MNIKFETVVSVDFSKSGTQRGARIHGDEFSSRTANGGGTSRVAHALRRQRRNVLYFYTEYKIIPAH